MGHSSSIFKEQELDEFRKLKPGKNEAEVPTPPENRTVTDKKGFVIFGILILVLVPFLIYALTHSDIRRITYGHDDCGNLCGVANKKIDGVSCSGKDYIDQPYETINIVTSERSCTAKCPDGYVGDGHICVGDIEGGAASIDSFGLWRYYLKLWWKFILITLITTTLCILTLVVFRFCPAVLVWGITVLGILIAIGLTALFWVLFNQTDGNNGIKHGYLALALISTLFTIAIVIVFLASVKKIPLIVLLYKETTKVLFSMPLMILLPTFTLLLQFSVLVLMVITTTYLGTSAELTPEESGPNYVYQMNGVMKFTMIFNFIVTLWSLYFFSGCQYMVLSGSVAQWFFKKDQVDSPILISFTNTIKFHLGTVAFGSFIITLTVVLKAVIKSFICNSRLRSLFNCCCGNIEALLKFLSKNSYIETAIYGQSFTRSGKRAANLLVKNAATVVALNCVGNFVLAMLQFLLLVISTAIAYGIFMNNLYSWLPTLFAFLINLIIVMIVFSVFESIVDTLFICYCEDTEMSDGSAEKPYAMTKEFMQFMEASRKKLDNRY